jgi:hypothetical protein
MRSRGEPTRCALAATSASWGAIRLARAANVRRVLGVCMAILCIGCAASASAGAVGYVDGISDQHFGSWAGTFSEASGFTSPFPSFFADSWVGSPPSHIKLSRYIVQWDVMRGVGYSGELTNLDAWYNHTIALGLTPDLALANYGCTGCVAPEKTEYYTRELEALHSALPSVTVFEAWNEPNHAGNFYVSPVAAAHFTNAAYSFCASHGCTAIAGDFLDSESNMVKYEEEYESNLSPRDPVNWGIHPYANVKYEAESHTVEHFKAKLPNPSTDSIWFTEVGAYNCELGELRGLEKQEKSAKYLVNHLIPEFAPVHVFYYQAAWPYDEQPPCNSETLDTALYAAQSTNGPVLARPAASIIFGPEGSPTASTGAATGIQPLQATVSGSVNPQGLDAAEGHFEYGTSPSYGLSTPKSNVGPGLNSVGESATITKLEPGTTYHYRIIATSTAGTGPGSEQTFKTPGPVEAVTSAASGMTEEQATLNGTVNPRGYDAKYYFQYGTTASYGLKTEPEGDAGAGSNPVPATAPITKLAAGTVYHYRLVGVSGGVTSYGADETFRTHVAPSMVVSNGTPVAATEGVNNGLTTTTADFAQQTWQSALLTASYSMYSAPSAAAESSGNVWIASEGPGNSLRVGLDRVSGGWSPSYEGPTGTTYSVPSVAIDSTGNVWVVAEGPNHTLNAAEWVKSKGAWETSTLVTGEDVYSAPSAARDSGGDVWVAFEGPSNSLWDGVRTTSGAWSTSYEGPTGTTYSAPSEAIDSSNNVWVFAQGPTNTLAQAEMVKSKGSWETVTVISAADVYSTPSTAVDSGGDVWVAFEGPSNSLWDGVRTTSGAWSTSYEGPTETTYSVPSEAIDSANDVWVGAQGASNSLNVTVYLKASGTWEASYEGTSEPSPTVSSPSVVVASGNPSAFTQTLSSGLSRTTADFSQNMWPSTVLGASLDTTYSAPSAAAESTGNVWVAAEGPSNSLWVGLDRVSGGWGPSYEGPNGTTYSAPSVVIDPNGDVFVVAEGPRHTLDLAEWVKSKGAWETSTLVTGEDVYSTPSAAVDASGDVWVAFEGPSNQLWIGLRRASGEWGMSYEGSNSTTYSAPSTVVGSSNVWVAAEGPNHALNLAAWSSRGWETSTPISASDVDSAPSAALDSGGDVWVAFEGPSNSLWDGVRTTSGAWSTSYEGPTGTTYSAPSEAIDSANNIWVGAQGPGDSLNVTVYLKASSIWEASYEGG